MECQCDELRDKIRNMVITFRNDSNDAIAEIDRLTEQLAEANKHKQDWHNMYQETYDQLVAVNRELECYKIQFEKDYSESDIEMIMRLSCQLAELDAEIALLRQQSVGWVQVFDENVALREEVERLKNPLVDAPAAYENGRKQTVREIIEMLRGAPNGFYIANIIKQRYGLEV